MARPHRYAKRCGRECGSPNCTREGAPAFRSVSGRIGPTAPFLLRPSFPELRRTGRAVVFYRNPGLKLRAES
jgi:hypothetical protein